MTRMKTALSLVASPTRRKSTSKRKVSRREYSTWTHKPSVTLEPVTEVAKRLSHDNTGNRNREGAIGKKGRCSK